MTEPELSPTPSDDPLPVGSPRGLVASLYRAEWARWRAHYRRYFKASARALGLGFILGFAVFLIWPAQEKKAMVLLLKALKDIPLGAPPLVLALTLFYHNARASLLAVAAGVLPFLCLPILDPFVNGAALGLLASVSKHQGLNVPLLFLKSVLPHGLFELPAVLYAASAGIHLSVTVGKLIRAEFKKRRTGTSGDIGTNDLGIPETKTPEGPGFIALIVEALASVARSFVLVVLPLLLVAAFVEAFVTPLLI